MVRSTSVAHPGHRLRAVGARQQEFGPVVGSRHVGIAEDLEVLVVVVLEHWGHEERLAMAAEVRRDVTDPQSAVGSTISLATTRRQGEPPAV